MGAALVPLVIVLAVLVLVGAVVVAFSRRQARERQEVLESDTVSFRVPEGQDPAALLAALHTAGYDAALATAATDPVLAVTTEGPADREAIRSVIATAPTNPEGDHLGTREIRFLDE